VKYKITASIAKAIDATSRPATIGSPINLPAAPIR
jgi:hypothetical protein